MVLSPHLTEGPQLLGWPTLWPSEPCLTGLLALMGFSLTCSPAPDLLVALGK